MVISTQFRKKAYRLAHAFYTAINVFKYKIIDVKIMACVMRYPAVTSFCL